MLVGFVTAASILLLMAGAGKVIHPDPASNALGTVGLPTHPLLVRTGAVVECAIALGAMLTGDMAWILLVGASYAGFAGFILLLRRQPDASSCGCFGGEGEVPSLRHVVLDVLVALGCVGGALVHTPTIASVFRGDLVLGVGTLALSIIAAWFAVLVLRAPGELAVAQ